MDSIDPLSFAETSRQALLKALLAGDLFDGLEVLQNCVRDLQIIRRGLVVGSL